MTALAMTLLRNYILYNIEDLYWKTLNDENIRHTLKRGMVLFAPNPNLALKCFLLLYFPKIFYKQYKISFSADS